MSFVARADDAGLLADHLPLRPDRPLQPPVRVVQKPHHRRLLIGWGQRQSHVTEIGVAKTRCPLSNCRARYQDIPPMRCKTEEQRIVTRRGYARPRVSDDVFGSAFPIAVGHANCARKRIHRMNDQLPFADSLIACFVKRRHKARGAAIPTQSDLPIPEASHDPVAVANWELRFSEKRLTALNIPMTGNTASPR